MEGDMKLGAPSGKAEKGKVSGGFSAAKRASGSSRALSGKPKVFETKKEKKRRLILSDSDEEKASPRHKAGKASVGPKEKMDDSLEGRGELGINEKRTADAGVDKKRRKTDSLRVKGDSETSGRRIKGETSKHSEEKIDVFDPYAYRDDDEIDRKIIMSVGRETQKNFIGPSRCRDDSDINLSKIKRESLKRKGGKTDVSDSFVNSDDDGTDVKRVMDGGTLKKSKSTDSFRSKAGADIDRKNMKMESGKGKEENSDIKGCWDLGTRLVGPTSRQKEGGMKCSRSRMVDKKTPSSLHRNSGLAFQRKRKTDVFDKKRFQLEKDDDVQVIGVAQEKFDADATIGVQDKSGISKLRTNNKMKVDKCEKRGKKTDEECMKNFGSATIRRKAVPRHSLSEEKKSPGKTNSATVMVKNLTKERKVLSSDRNKVDEIKQGSSDRTLKVRLKNKDAFSIKPVDTSMQLRRSVMESPNTSEQKEKGQKRGRAKEKQLLREQIKDMLVNAGWKIDCRQRMSRNYKDFVYIAPAGREYWSIVNAYNAFQKQLNSEGEDGTDVQKLNGRKSLFPVIPAEVLSILKRKTREKTEKQKKKLKSGKVSENAKIATKKKFAKNRCPKETAAGRKKKDKPDSCVVQEGKSLKGRVKQNGLSGLDMKGLVRNLKARNLANKPGYRNGQISLKKQGNSADSVDKETLESVSSEKPFCTSDARFPLGVKQKRQRGCSLLARRSVEGADVDADDFVSYAGKRSVLSWLIDSGTVPEDGKVQYMNKRRSRAMLKGLITRDGIHCYCCSKILTVSKFEIHAGSKLCQPFQNIFVESGVSLLQCQLDAWNKQEESERRGFHFIDPNGDDPNDDTCGICGDGGDLICCDGCPSTYHLRCLNIQMLPPGDWHCPNCSCRFCGAVCCSPQGVSSLLLSCSQCGEKYHQECIEEADVVSVEPNSLSMPFCGHNCEKLFKHLQELLGVKNELEAGFSWTLLQRFDEGSDTSLHELPQRAECNSNLAVALAVMDECFFPIIDRRSGFNLIHNVLYNCGSNFNRLNYSAFYTIVLERGDEIISAASIRIHGTRLAEMPFIGTRHMYRRQGMCRRLLNALESALCSLHVEKLIIPAISELMHTWTKVFDFKPLEESHRQEIRSMNLMVFPGTDMLQKPLLKHVSKEGNANTSADVVAVEFKNNPHDASEVANEASSGGPVIHSCDELEDRVATAGSGLHACHDSRATSDSPTESNLQADGAVCYVSKPQDKSESSPEIAFPCHTHGENQSLLISPNEPTFHASGDGTVHDTYGGRVDVAAKPNDHISGGGSWHSTAEVATQSADAACGYTLQASGERALYHDSDSYTQDAATTCKFSASGEIIAQHEPEFVGEAIECSSTSALSLPCDTAHHDVVDAAQPDLSSSDSAMQATVKVNDEFLAIERKSHNLDSYSVHCVSKGVSESLKTASESNCVSNVDDKSSELLGKSLSSSSDMSPLSDADVVHHNSHQGVKESLVVFAAESSHHKGTVPDTDKIGVGIASVELNKYTFGSSLFGTSEITTEPLEAISEPKVQISGNGNVRCNSKSSYKSPEVASVAVQNGSPVTNGSTATLVDQGLHTSSEGTPAVQKGHCNSESLYNPSSSSSVDRHSSGGANVCDISDMEIRSEQASCVVPVHASAEHVVNDNDLEALPSITLEGSI